MNSQPNRYPGMDTEFYIVLNGVVTGPLTGLVEVSKYNPVPDTPVWYDGLDDWKPAIMAPLTRQLFEPGSPYHRAMSQPVYDEEPTPPALEVPEERRPDITPETRADESGTGHTEPAAVYVAAPAPVEAAPPCPKSYLAWAIVVTIVLNLICGVVAIIYAAKVRGKYNAGNYEGARRCSESAQWWIAGGIALGLIMTVFRIFSGSLF